VEGVRECLVGRPEDHVQVVSVDGTTILKWT
jgi:hypothetical protein